MHGTAKLSARDQVLRRPNSGESDGSQPREPQTNDNEARNDFWTISGSFFYRSHALPRVVFYGAQRKGHSRYHLNALTLSDGEIRHRMFCYRVALTIIGTLMVVRTTFTQVTILNGNLQMTHVVLEAVDKKIKNSRSDSYDQRFDPAGR